MTLSDRPPLSGPEHPEQALSMHAIYGPHEIWHHLPFLLDSVSTLVEKVVLADHLKIRWWKLSCWPGHRLKINDNDIADLLF